MSLYKIDWLDRMWSIVQVHGTHSTKKIKKDSAEIYKDDIKNMESKSYEDRLRYLACGLSRREKINRI